VDSWIGEVVRISLKSDPRMQLLTTDIMWGSRRRALIVKKNPEMENDPSGLFHVEPVCNCNGKYVRLRSHVYGSYLYPPGKPGGDEPLVVWAGALGLDMMSKSTFELEIIEEQEVRLRSVHRNHKVVYVTEKFMGGLGQQINTRTKGYEGKSEFVLTNVNKAIPKEMKLFQEEILSLREEAERSKQEVCELKEQITLLKEQMSFFKSMFVSMAQNSNQLPAMNLNISNVTTNKSATINAVDMDETEESD